MVVILDSFDSHLDKTINIQSEYWETSAYIKSILKKFVNCEKNLQSQSMVLMWFNAKHTFSFEKFQDIGDWIFFNRTLFPESIACDINFYSSIGKSSYYECYKKLNGAWPLYEELADRFDYFVKSIRDSAFSL